MKYMIIDGNSILNRAFYAAPPLKDNSGTPTGAVYGFLNIMTRYISMYSPDAIAVAFDLKSKTFRHKMFDQYKAGRKSMPDDLFVQMPIIKEILSVFGIKYFEIEGFEADDILGKISKLCDTNGDTCYILTGDRDSFQLITDNVSIIMPSTSKGKAITTLYNKEEIFEKYGIMPIQFRDMKALMGDASDNIPGVSGIGEKTALTLIKNFHNIDNIYKNIDNPIIKKGMREKLIRDKEMAYLSKDLGTINTDFDFDIDTKSLVIKPVNTQDVKNILLKYNFKSLITKYNLSGDSFSITNFKESQDESSSDNSLASAKTEINTNNNILVPDCEIKTLSETEFINNAFKNKKIFLFYNDNTLYSFTDNIYKIDGSQDKIKFALKAIFADENTEKYAHDIKSLYNLYFDSNNYNENQANNVIFDFSLAAYLINPDIKDFSLDFLMLEFLGASSSNSENLVSLMPKLFDVLSDKLKKDELSDLFYNIELPLARVLAHMEYVGITADKNALIAFGGNLDDLIADVTTKIYDIAGEEFNISSPKQLGVILFEKLGIKPPKKTKTGYSTNVDVLEKLKKDYPIASYILEYRHYTKLKSTYVDGLLKYLKNTNKIHTTFQQTVTLTGRLSSTDPNLQNIPVRTPLGREMRKMFIAKNDDYILVDADYSQIELRVLAHIANDTAMLEAFHNGEDIHASTASRAFGVPMIMVDDALRSAAKAVNFGIVYGISSFSLSQDLGISVAQAKNYIDSYLTTYSGVKNYMNSSVQLATKNGYAKTLLGRRRYIHELSSSNKITKAFGERIAMNMPIQGTAADIIKLAMINVANRLANENLDANLILQIHDELIIECHKSIKDTVCKILKEEMENSIKLNVTLTADVKSGYCWYDAK